jgi:uridine phosphorylase
MGKINAQPITGCGEGDFAPHVFLCGDPERVPKISADWNDVKEVCRIREYVVHTGTKDGIALSAASTGVGGASTAVILEEAAKLGARTFLRIGNSGALADHVELGDYVITTASVRDEGTSKSYVREDFPAAAHFEVVQGLVTAAAASGHRFHTGVTWSIDGFYARNKVVGEGGELRSMSFGSYQQSWMNGMVADMKSAGVLNVEMESSTILTLATIYGLRAGCICTVSDRTPWPGPGQDSITLDRNMDGAIEVAMDAMLHLAAEPGEPRE